MKKISLFILLLLCWLGAGSLLAQLQLDRQVIATAGGTGSTEAFQLSATLGETVTTSFIGADRQLTQGFQQSRQVISDVIDFAGGIEIELFPNPATDFATLSLEMPQSTPLRIQLVDIAGRVVLRYQPAVETTDYRQNFDLRNLSAGTYFVKILSPNGRVLKTLKLINTN